ncbi:Tyrosine-protein kinase [Parasponia andersonii]|uniref:Tyrosine-protein kinase n=1 Tax=Parasponia andersonii TaxID=3476 RepID=A0A2P5CV92_PARAD|nr:Tyrosine-protein kinase [Parasponia andersonii]
MLPVSAGKKSNTSRTVIIAVLVPIAVSVLLFIFVCVFLRKRRTKREIESRPLYESVDEIESAESLQYSFETIRVATDNVSETNKLGQGGFGAVYKGRLSNGQDVAVKRLSMGSKQGELEFKNEVMCTLNIIAGMEKLKRRNSYEYLPAEPVFFMRTTMGSDLTLASDFNSRVTDQLDHSKSESIKASVNEASITYPR